jgi:hypothetical protein
MKNYSRDLHNNNKSFSNANKNLERQLESKLFYNNIKKIEKNVIHDDNLFKRSQNNLSFSLIKEIQKLSNDFQANSNNRNNMNMNNKQSRENQVFNNNKRVLSTPKSREVSFKAGYNLEDITDEFMNFKKNKLVKQYQSKSKRVLSIMHENKSSEFIINKPSYHNTITQYDNSLVYSGEKIKNNNFRMNFNSINFNAQNQQLAETLNRCVYNPRPLSANSDRGNHNFEQKMFDKINRKNIDFKLNEIKDNYFGPFYKDTLLTDKGNTPLLDTIQTELKYNKKSKLEKRIFIDSHSKINANEILSLDSYNNIGNKLKFNIKNEKSFMNSKPLYQNISKYDVYKDPLKLDFKKDENYAIKKSYEKSKLFSDIKSKNKINLQKNTEKNYYADNLYNKLTSCDKNTSFMINQDNFKDKLLNFKSRLDLKY